MYARMNGLGLVATPDQELARIRAERAQVDAEIARLASGGAAVPGGFQPQLAITVPPPSPTYRRLAIPMLGVVGLATLGLYLFFKKKR